MKIGLHSRFCDSCKKNVIDFTNKDRKEILEYLLTNRTERVCGRIYRSQLDLSSTDFLVTIQALARQHKNTNLSFYLLTVGTMILASCNNTTDPKRLTKIDTTIINSDTTNRQEAKNVESKDTIGKCVKNHNHLPPVIPDEILLGDVALLPYPDKEPYQYVDIMPEFKGGIDSLTSFIKQNLEYPEWERENKIEGKVFVNFVVNKNGKITDPKILRSVQGSKNFDKEVIRVINNMPDWTPGQQDGKNVDVQFNLPIHFKQ
ncbi:MAG TPA: energy transducer TonB [Bacteroidia bacterium]|nr:energy transducer TonB [Bacteroidia bacterium]